MLTYQCVICSLYKAEIGNKLIKYCLLSFVVPPILLLWKNDWTLILSQINIPAYAWVQEITLLNLLYKDYYYFFVAEYLITIFLCLLLKEICISVFQYRVPVYLLFTWKYGKGKRNFKQHQSPATSYIKPYRPPP